jgi:Major Facilitator Superfamily.
VVGAIGYPVGAAIMIFVSDKLQRKILIFIDTVVWFFGMIIFGLATKDALFIGAFLGSLGLGMYLQVAYTFTAESYPTRARTSGFALTDGIGHGGGALGAILLPVLVAAYSFSFGFTFIAITGLVAGIVALLGPVASKRSLENISK